MRSLVLATLMLTGFSSPVLAQPRLVQERVSAMQAHAEVTRHINGLTATAAATGHQGVAQALLNARHRVDQALNPVASAAGLTGKEITVTRQGGGSRFDLPNGSHVTLWSDAVRVRERRRDRSTAVYEIEVDRTMSLSREQVIRADSTIARRDTLLSLKSHLGVVTEHALKGTVDAER